MAARSRDPREGSGEPRPPWLTPRRLRAVLLGAVLAGALLPPLTVLLKLSAHDFELWSSLKVSNRLVARAIQAWPALDVSRSLPWLADVAWQSTNDRHLHEIYVRIGAWNAAFLAGLLLFRRRLLGLCERLCGWLHAPGETRARRIVFATGLLLFCAWVTRTPLGFWFPGIGGWTYEHLEPSRRDTPFPEALSGPEEEHAPTAEERAWLEPTLLPQNARWLPGPGYVGGTAMTLHYADGSVHPGSYELTGLVFPHYVFGTLYGRVDRPELFLRLVRHTLAYRRRGTRFLLPLAVGYPNHCAYEPLDYTGTPPPETLRRIVLWTYTLKVGADRSVEIVSVRRKAEVDA
jgi:hypothetical protein